MEYFLIEHHFYGLVVGTITFLIIGLFHPLVIKTEYYLGTKSWWIFLFLGVICIFLSVMIGNILWSTILGVIAFSSFWSILELFKQKERVKKGWFPSNPKKK